MLSYSAWAADAPDRVNQYRLTFASSLSRSTASSGSSALARELEVSVRTARRDLEALAMAGIPVYSQPGRGGGWSLLGGGRTDLSGLTAAEARTLFLLAGPSAAVAPEAKSALRKLVRALPEPMRAEASAAASSMVIDTALWGQPGGDVPAHLETLQRALVRRRQVRLRYASPRGGASERTVHPLGLVRKARRWYLVAGTEAGTRTFRVDRVSGAEMLPEPADRPADFDLERAWEAAVGRTEELRRQVSARLRAAASFLEHLRDRFGDDLSVLGEARRGVFDLALRGPDAETLADELAGWAVDIEVVGPDEVRDHLARIGRALVRRYTTGDSSL